MQTNVDKLGERLDAIKRRSELRNQHGVIMNRIDNLKDKIKNLTKEAVFLSEEIADISKFLEESK